MTPSARHLHLVACAALLSGGALHAQGTTQLSLTGTVVLPYDKKWTFVGEANPSRVVNGSPEWNEVMLSVGAERVMVPGVDLLGYGYFYHTNQFEDVNTSELRLRLGVQPYWRPAAKWFLQGRAVVENRWIHYEGGSWDYTIRARMRAMTRYTIRRANEYRPGAVYLRADIEGYVPFGDKATERYFDRVAVRTGGGYRFSIRDQGELYLVRRASEMTVLSDRDNSDWVIEFKYTHVLARPTPHVPEPTP